MFRPSSRTWTRIVTDRRILWPKIVPYLSKAFIQSGVATDAPFFSVWEQTAFSSKDLPRAPFLDLGSWLKGTLTANTHTHAHFSRLVWQWFLDTMGSCVNAKKE